MKPLDAMRAVLSSDHRLSKTERLVLVALVICRNNENALCCPGQGTIGAMVGMNERAVRGVAKRLESAGIIERLTPPGGSTRYTLHLDRITATPRNAVPPRNGKPGRNAVPVTPEAASGDPGTACRLTAVVTANQLPTEPQGMDEMFEKAWAAYPKRAGGNPRLSALKNWRARVREGANPAELVAGVERYAAFVRADGKEGTVYVKQAATFFGPGGHWSEDYALPGGVEGAKRKVGPGGILLGA